MNHTALRWYTVEYTLRNNRRTSRHTVEVSATTESEALLRARDHVRVFRRSRIYNPVVRLSDKTI